MKPDVPSPSDRKAIVLFGASPRAVRFLEKLIELRPNDTLLVCSFRGDPWEPEFFDEMKEISESNGAMFHEVRSIGAKGWKQITVGNDVDLLFAVGWRYIIPRAVYSQVQKAAVTFHDSLLPKYRGFAPTNWAIINGEKETGATLFLMSDQVDAGPIIGQSTVGIGPDDTIGEVAERVTSVYLSLLETHIESLLDGSFAAFPQIEADASVTTKRTPEDGLINWASNSAEIHNLVRALTSPWPGAYTFLEGRKMLVWNTKRYEGPPISGGVPGRVVPSSNQDGAVTIATGDSAIVLLKVQYEGEPLSYAADLIKSVSSTLGR